MNHEEFDQAIAAHDAAVAGKDCDIWVGSEPTFTDRFSEAPEWLFEALGSDKELRARALLRQLHSQTKGAVVLRSIGRQYPEEDLPRWSYGLYSRRDEKTIYNGARDPLLCDEYQQTDEATLIALQQQLCFQLNAIGWTTESFQVAHEHFYLRIIARTDGQSLTGTALDDARLSRVSIHDGPVPLAGLEDDLSDEGILLFLIGHRLEVHNGETRSLACIELPLFSNTHIFDLFLTALAKATDEVGLAHLVVSGFAPPVDENIAWTTVTPDPAVIEINMAPYPSVGLYLTHMRELFSAASSTGLSPKRLHYNGAIADSGGGGHMTLGGAAPAQSVFITTPQLLPRLIAYFNRHPSLSYFFAVDHVGSSGQSPRADEGLPDRFNELQLALDTLARQQLNDMNQVWQTLAPFMTDYMGNNHRSELNVEKLCNPYLPGRGRLGLIEFRAFRMAPTPERSAAIAALLRAITTMLSTGEYAMHLTKWGDELHDRFALPFYLKQDLCEVLSDLNATGLGLGMPIVDQLLDDSRRVLGRVEVDAYTITVKSAIEFWPLVGNVAAQEGGTSRLMDSSGRRIEISIQAPGVETEALYDWQVFIDKYAITMRKEADEAGAYLVFALRYRSFYPQMGLHPAIDAHGPIQLTFTHPNQSNAIRITLLEWHPGNVAYDGLPRDEYEAAQRCSERFVVEVIQGAEKIDTRTVPSAALTPYTLDLR